MASPTSGLRPASLGVGFLSSQLSWRVSSPLFVVAGLYHWYPFLVIWWDSGESGDTTAVPSVFLEEPYYTEILFSKPGSLLLGSWIVKGKSKIGGLVMCLQKSVKLLPVPPGDILMSCLSKLVFRGILGKI